MSYSQFTPAVIKLKFALLLLARRRLEMAAGAAALPRLGALLLPFLAVAACLDVPSHGNAPTNNPVMTHLSEANDGPAVLS